MLDLEPTAWPKRLAAPPAAAAGAEEGAEVWGAGVVALEFTVPFKEPAGLESALIWALEWKVMGGG